MPVPRVVFRFFHQIPTMVRDLWVVSVPVERLQWTSTCNLKGKVETRSSLPTRAWSRTDHFSQKIGRWRKPCPEREWHTKESVHFFLLVLILLWQCWPCNLNSKLVFQFSIGVFTARVRSSSGYSHRARNSVQKFDNAMTYLFSVVKLQRDPFGTFQFRSNATDHVTETMKINFWKQLRIVTPPEIHELQCQKTII